MTTEAQQERARAVVWMRNEAKRQRALSERLAKVGFGILNSDRLLQSAVTLEAASESIERCEHLKENNQ